MGGGYPTPLPEFCLTDRWGVDRWSKLSKLGQNRRFGGYPLGGVKTPQNDHFTLIKGFFSLP